MYGKQIHKTGVNLTLLYDDPKIAKYTNRDELRKLFELEPEGTCPMMDTLQSIGRCTTVRETKLNAKILTHDSVIGFAHHDKIYKESSKRKRISAGNKVTSPVETISIPDPKFSASEVSVLTEEMDDNDSGGDVSVELPPDPKKLKFD